MRPRRVLVALGLCSVIVACDAFSGDEPGGSGATEVPSTPDAGSALDAAAEAATPLPSPDGGPGSTCPNPLPSGTSAYRAAVAADCPRAYFPLDEAQGSSEAQNAVGSPPATLARPPNAESQIAVGVPGRVGSAVSFGGLNEGFSIAITFAPADVFTIEALVRPIMNFATVPLFLDLNASATAGFKVTMSRRQNALDALLSVSTSAQNPLTALASVDMMNNSPDLGWHHVAAVIDASSFRVYLDGAEGSVPSGVARPGTSGVPLTFGHFFTGIVDEVAIYDRALTKEQIASHVAKLP